MKGNNILKAEYRAEPIKTLEEKRGGLVSEMEQLIDKAKAEVRAFTDEEQTKIGELEKEIKGLNATIEAERRAEEVKAGINAKKQEERFAPEQRAEGSAQQQNTNITEAEKRALLSYIKSSVGLPVEIRAGEQNITMGNNGNAIVPISIANQIINKVNEICPIMGRSTRYNVKGKLKIPVWGDASGHNITVGYQEEFEDIIADAGKFTSIELEGYLCSCLVLVGKNVINNSQIDITSFLITEMAKQIAIFNEKELLTGTAKIQGALNTTNIFTANSATAITSDDLIDLQSKVPTVYQADACWTMNPDTFTRIRKLKDANGQYLMMSNTGNISNAFPYMLLGKPVYLSDNMPAVEAGAKSILYGDYSGLSTNMRQEIEITILDQPYATKHAIGILMNYDLDAKVTDHQKLAVLKQKATASSGT